MAQGKKATSLRDRFAWGVLIASIIACLVFGLVALFTMGTKLAENCGGLMILFIALAALATMMIRTSDDAPGPDQLQRGDFS